MKRLISLFALIALLPLWASAATWPEHQNTFINDYADMLDATTEAQLRAKLENLRRDTGIEATIVTLPSRKPFQNSGTLEDFSIGLINEWGVGDPEKNDGILMLVLKDDRETTIELGKGYAPQASAEARDIIDNIMVKAFRAGDYSGGIVQGMDAILTRIAKYQPAPAATPGTAAPAGAGTAPKSGGAGKWVLWAFGGIFAALIGWGIFGRRVKDRLSTCPQCGKKGLQTRRSVLTPPTTEAEGRGEEVVRCSHCDYEKRSEYTIPKVTPPKEDKFGGGASDGGGASGKW